MPSILTDIEGTTSSIKFVHQVLFPLAKKEMANYVRQQWHKQDNQEAFELIKASLRKENQIQDASVEEVIETLDLWMEQDRKHQGLKILQGKIWRQAYENGQVKGHIYLDAAEQLKHWYSQGWKLAVYSSGSVEAQKLLFGFSEFGDLRDLFSEYFDTSVGSKKDVSSYTEISKYLPQPIYFLSDIAEELQAAQKANMRVIQLDRDNVLDTKSWPVAKDFEEVNKFLKIEKN